MKNGKPRGPVPSLIGSTLGAPTLIVVKKQCNCKRCAAALKKDTKCYAIPQLGGSFANSRRYCSACFNLILEKTKSELEELITASET